jgi:mRNA-degrading endonuclease RelE of RelBE toxin-antitoxin system
VIDKATLEKLKNFPPQYQQEVKDFIDFLEQRKVNPLAEKKNRQAGAMKGFLIYMAPDFDEPLEDFKEYM